MTERAIFSDEYYGPRYTYGLQYRPLDIGAQPKGWIVGSLKQHTAYRWGTIDYPRELTEEEVYGFELVPVRKDEEGILPTDHASHSIVRVLFHSQLILATVYHDPDGDINEIDYDFEPGNDEEEGNLLDAITEVFQRYYELEPIPAF